MRIKTVQMRSFKRFTDLTITDIPATARLVVLLGPNGSGKSCVFEAFRMWHSRKVFGGYTDDPAYYHKHGLPQEDYGRCVLVEFHEPLPADKDQRKKIFYFRSAYRNDPDFTVRTLEHQGPPVELPTHKRIIDNETLVSSNYHRLVSATVEAVYAGGADDLSVAQLREKLIGRARAALYRVFGDLLLTGTGDPLVDGSFYFRKGTSDGFHYKNLSAGEKAAFDLLLDVVLKADDFQHTVFAIDEPEAHLHASLQGLLLHQLLDMLPEKSQLWLATQAIGMMRAARDIENQNPGTVAFVDFTARDFDQQVTLTPEQLGRAFWRRSLEIALDDLANLVAPQVIVLCEGGGSPRGDPPFDAACYGTIFASGFPDVEFFSVGSSSEVERDRLAIGQTLQAVVPGTEVVRLIDRDDRTGSEISALQKKRVRVLRRRQIEAYLLDDEIVGCLCQRHQRNDLEEEAIRIKQEAILRSTERGNPPDDVKSAAGEIYTGLRRLLGLTACGSTAAAFLKDTMAPLVTPGTNTYDELKQDIFGPDSQ